jgi:MFS family permease
MWRGAGVLTPEGLVAAVPYGFVADKYGRKLVLLLCMAGIYLVSIATIVICKTTAPIKRRQNIDYMYQLCGPTSSQFDLSGPPLG